MALTICPDCGRKVSKMASVCPECGRPFASGKSNTVQKIEFTSKRFKVAKALSSLFTLVGFAVIALSPKGANYPVIFGSFAVALGLYTYAAVGIWWHHD